MPRRKKPKIQPIIAVIDAETDPFRHDRVPRPFCWEFRTALFRKVFWGPTCTEELYDFLVNTLKDPYIIYAHNGGKFDFFFMLQEKMLENPMFLIKGRIVSSKLGIHELRDSFSILPLPLDKLAPKGMGKKKIDYNLMEALLREANKNEIIEYLDADCDTLLSRVQDFWDRFGDQLTIASTAIKELQKFHPEMVPHRGAFHDGSVGPDDRRADGSYQRGTDCWIDNNSGFRRFYYGGRVEAFETGEIVASSGRTIKFYDINSSYPKSMKDYDHPTSGNYFITAGEEACNRMHKKFNAKTGRFDGYGGMYFMRFIGKNKGALPTRAEDGSLTFNQPFGEFFACSHEIEVACKYGLIEVNQIKEILIPHFWGRYEEFVNYWYAEKAKCKVTGDFVGELFAKLILNSSYGRFALSPWQFREWYIVDRSSIAESEKFEQWHGKAIKPSKVQDAGNFELWDARTVPRDRQFMDVAVAASITSASRAQLLEAICLGLRPIYCDTDSLICEALKGVEMDNFELGAWKFEGETDRIFVAGKKLYGAELFELDKVTGERKIKLASKGARLTFDQMKKVALGEVVHWECEAPNFRLTGEVKFTDRRIVRRDRAA
jgi:hypothetical protein